MAPQGWLDLPKEDESALAATGEIAEKWVRHWFVLRNTVLNMYTEEQKEKGALAEPGWRTWRRRRPGRRAEEQQRAGVAEEGAPEGAGAA